MSIARIVTVGVALLALIALGAPPPAAAELKVSIGGYVKLDLEYQDKITSAGGNRALPAPQNTAFDRGPSGPGGPALSKDNVKSRNDQFILEAKETRFNLTATDKAGDVDLKGFIEVDFFGGLNPDGESNSLVSNAGVIRLRHAMAQGTMPWGAGKLTLLVGQFWHAFGYLEGPISRPSTVSFDLTPGLFAREPQVKLTFSIPFGKEWLNLIGAVSPNAVAFTPRATSVANAVCGVAGAFGCADHTRQEGQNIPSFTAKLQWLGSMFQAEVAGIATEVKGIDVTGQRIGELAYGLQGTAAVSLGPLRVAAHGDNLHGLNRHSTASFADAVFRGTGSPAVPATNAGIALIDTVGLWGGASYALTPTTSFNGIYDIRFADSSGHSGYGRDTGIGCAGIAGNPGAFAPANPACLDVVRLQAVHVNLLQKFWQRFQFGIEYQRQWVDAFRQNSGAQNLYHAAFWYFF